MERFSIIHLFFWGENLSYPVKTDEHGNAIPPLPYREPSKQVPKKYWKYASKYPTRQLYSVHWVAYGLICKCTECGKEIPAMERFLRLCFREPKTMFARKVCIALCLRCWVGLEIEKEKAKP